MIDAGRFAKLTALDPAEIVTHAHERDVPISAGRTLALVTLDNGFGPARPNTLGPNSLLEFAQVLDVQRARAGNGEIHGLAVTGSQHVLAAGADLSKVGEIRERELGRLLGELGHEALGRLHDFGVPTFVFIDGIALGGGAEICLNADYRTVNSSTRAFGFPEVHLGLIPGWGSAWLLPNLIGIENAIEVIVANPLKNNRLLSGPQLLELGIADAMFGPAAFLEDSIRWADAVISGRITVERRHMPDTDDRGENWDVAIDSAEQSVERRIGRVAASPYKAIELLKAARSTDRAQGFEAENAALEELIAGDQFRASLYAFDLVNRRAKRPAGAPDRALAHAVGKVGVIGAGLMARQFALAFVQRLRVPVIIADLDQKRVDDGVARIRADIEDLLAKGRISPDERNRLVALVAGTTDTADFANCDWVIEAIFEETGAKQEALAEVERYLAEDAVLATNTSSLSVEAIGAKLEHPERLVGFHFFNPVAAMPLIEVVRTPRTTDVALATAMRMAAELGKNAVVVKDSTGFVVNRVLAKMLGEAMHAVEHGSPFQSVVDALKPFGLPMDPFVLLELIGLRVGAHVLDTHHRAFPDRFFASAALDELADYGAILERDHDGKVTGVDAAAQAIVDRHRPQDGKAFDAEQLRMRFEDGLADEIHRMLQDGVVAAAEDVDLCMILGAGYPFQTGGITPYLDRVGASERAFGDTFHHPPIRGVA